MFIVYKIELMIMRSIINCKKVVMRYKRRVKKSANTHHFLLRNLQNYK